MKKLILKHLQTENLLSKDYLCFALVKGLFLEFSKAGLKELYTHIPHIFVKVNLKNLSNSIKLNFKFRREVQVSEKKF